MSEVTLTAEPRILTGSGPSRRFRAEDQIPAVVYGKNREAASVTVDRAELRQALTTHAGVNALIDLHVAGETMTAIVREIQRHPVRRDVIHVDFVVVDTSVLMEIDVPIVLVGEAKHVTLQGGMTEQRLNELKVMVRPDNIPDEITVDISELQLDEALLVKDLSLPDGVESLVPPEQAVVTSELTRAALVETDSGDEASAADEAEVAAEEE